MPLLDTDAMLPSCRRTNLRVADQWVNVPKSDFPHFHHSVHCTHVTPLFLHLLEEARFCPWCRCSCSRPTGSRHSSNSMLFLFQSQSFPSCMNVCSCGLPRGEEPASASRMTPRLFSTILRDASRPRLALSTLNILLCLQHW